MIHAKSDVLDQLVFSVDVDLTMQLVQGDLEQNDGEQTLSYLAKLRGQVPRASMTSIGESVYCVGKLDYAEVTEEEATALSITSTRVRTFSRAYLRGVLYHSTLYDKGKGKRNSRICKLSNDRGN